MNNPFQTFSMTQDGHIARVTFDHPPINLLDMEMIQEIDRAPGYPDCVVFVPGCADQTGGAEP